MVRIFLSAGHDVNDPGAIAGGTTEYTEMRKIRDAIVQNLRSRGLDVLWIPDSLDLIQTIYWINDNSRRGDVALEIHADAFGNTNVRGASIFYIDSNPQRKADAQLVLEALLKAVPGVPSRGAKPDTATGVGSLGFCRQVDIPSMLIELGFLTNPSDRSLLQTKRQDFARGIADGLQAWSQKEAIRQGLAPPAITYPVISVKLNDQLYKNQGILVNGNACIPFVFLKSLGIDTKLVANVPQVNYRNVVYIKAIELQKFKVSVRWDNATRTVVLSSK
ncbi:MAG: N-acetylmuramoyl-L-alanine amidase [Cyanobacteriota bacterium]|nr:N-acetylmuramoyl-L-alanine amidase [Cyanobacteriota bacterium]